VSLRVTVVDEQTGESDSQVVADGDYVIVTAEPCYVDGVQAYRNGTHVLTVKGRVDGWRGDVKATPTRGAA
jgi:hypothetical protein